MNEEIVIDILKRENISLVASLPCDKNKRLTYLLPEYFHTIDLAREEDGVGICAGAYLAGKKPIISIQSSGLGNMFNAIMSLSKVYELPLPILASWRGVCDEKICAQIPFNEPLPKVLDAFEIPYKIFDTGSSLEGLTEVIEEAFAKRTPYVALIKPSCWEMDEPILPEYPARHCPEKSITLPGYESPSMTRFDAIKILADFVSDDSVIISNIGVPSKELFAAKDRAQNFYMLGSYTQVSALGLGVALASEKQCYVIDGDGSLLGSAVLPVVAAENPKNFTIVALDNGTFGSTGNQITPAYATADIGLLAKAAGIDSVVRAETPEKLLSALLDGVRFIHVQIKLGNSDSPNIPIGPVEIKERFMKFLDEV